MTNSQLNTHITRATIAATLFFVGCGPPLVVVIHDHGDGDTGTEVTEVTEETEDAGDYTEGPEDLPVIADLPEPDPGDPGPCACHDPTTPGDGDGDPAGAPGCVCESAGGWSFCYNPFQCAYFDGGCPDGFSEICA